MNAVLSSFHFIRPEWLLLIPLVIALWWFWRRRSDPLHGWRAQIDPVLLEALSAGGGSAARGPARWLLVGWLLAVIAVAGPTWRPEPSPFADDVTPLMILLKADTSMDRPEPAPSRIERARLKIADLAVARKGQPLGLIVYAGSAHLVLPPTRDTEVVSKMAVEISPEIMPVPGDRLDLALRKAADILGAGSSGGSVLVVADSVGSDVGMIDLESLKETAQKAGRLPVNFLAINTPDSPESESLRRAAQVLNANVQSLTADDADVRAITRAASRAPVAQAGESSTRWQESGWLLVPVIALIFAGSFRREASTAEDAT
jgi:Ca-activated chloride channel family protein